MNFGVVWTASGRTWTRLGQQARRTPGLISSSAWPQVNVYDGGSNLVVKADVPGLSEKDVHVTLNESGLAISGQRTVAPPEGYSAHRQERSSFSFSRSLTLPCKVNPEQTQASVKNGVLTVTLAKAPEAQPRQIAVQAH
jgi:HSP20 family protein